VSCCRGETVTIRVMPRRERLRIAAVGHPGRLSVETGRNPENPSRTPTSSIWGMSALGTVCFPQAPAMGLRVASCRRKSAPGRFPLLFCGSKGYICQWLKVGLGGILRAEGCPRFRRLRGRASPLTDCAAAVAWVVVRVVLLVSVWRRLADRARSRSAGLVFT
jgi:hypothetical protein